MRLGNGMLSQVVTLSVLTVAFTACRQAAFGNEAVLVVAEVLNAELAGFAPSQTVTIAPMWINGDSLPTELAAGLRDATARGFWDMDAPRDGSIAVLAFHEPNPKDSDAIMVHVELLTFDNDGFYGRDWRFELDCRDACQVVDRTLVPGWLN